MIRMLEGITKTSTDTRYETLSNLAFFNSRSIIFTNILAETLTQLKKTVQLVKDVEIMESGL
jgi:hypothetical protein